MVIPIPARRTSQGPPTTTGGNHHWWKKGFVLGLLCGNMEFSSARPWTTSSWPSLRSI